MPANFVTVDTIDALESLFQLSFDRPVVLFKHSNRCGISSHVKEMVSAIDDDVNLIVVQTNRDVSNAVETRTGYRHQSPQAFVIRDGKAVYHATHYGIDPDKIEGLLGP